MYRQALERELEKVSKWGVNPSGDEPLGVHVHVLRPATRLGDADNYAKPTLDALGPVVGRTRKGRVRDERIRWLLVSIDESDETDRVDISIFEVRPDAEADAEGVGMDRLIHQACPACQILSHPS